MLTPWEESDPPERTFKYQANIITVLKGAGGSTRAGTRLGMVPGRLPLVTQPPGKARGCPGSGF